MYYCLLPLPLPIDNIYIYKFYQGQVFLLTDVIQSLTIVPGNGDQ